MPNALPSACSGELMTFCAFSSLLLVEARNLVMNSLFPLVGIESVISNTKQMSCSNLTAHLSRGWGQWHAMRHGKNSHKMPTSGLKHRDARIRTGIVPMRDVNQVTVVRPNTGTNLTPPQA